MKIKKVTPLLLAVLMMVTLAACTPRTTPPVEDENNNGNNNNIEEPAPEPEDKAATVKLYYANQQYIISGNESLDHTVEVEREVELGDKSIEEVVLEELKKQPEDESLATLLEKIEVLGAETKENIAYVDLSSENLHGGSMEEILTLKQIVFSLTSLEEVEAVQILVDGSKRETLMGHIVIEEPLKRSDI